ncbi:unnamed protein product [Cladocopium goreaui]|uniref:7,8-didemethyl-8-hydroxy-5-deazariboflavin synthase n=1 Tax=Cladocopium goreaui TaxID=2562237 RepID=A0A9P1FUC9_9DINO|nr:unnamed protein product [Cladocopium goreaui]
MDFAKWIDNFCPPLSGETKYITSFDVSGFARPWMLAWRSDFGTSGLYDPDMFLELIQLIMSEGFLTDPDQISVEKLSCCQVPTCFLDGSYEAMPNLYQHLLPPFSVGYLKGWKRALGLLTVLAAIRELNLESCVGHSFLATYGTIHVNFALKDADVRTQIMEWDNATAVAKAFAIGKGEAAAVSALMSDVNGLFLSRITESVKIRGMHRFLTHDAIGRGIFSTGFSSGIGNIEAWKDELTNRDDQELVGLFLQRLEFDHDHCFVDSRKACNFNQACKLHQLCGLYLFFLQRLRDIAPAADFPTISAGLLDQFLHGYLDGDLGHSLESSVPPGDLSSIGAFRRPLGSHVAQIQSVQREQQEQRSQELARAVAEATFKQLEAQIESDWAVLRAQMGSCEDQAVQTAKDLKYVRDRQQTGKIYVEKWMQEKCHLIRLPDDKDYNGVLPQFMTFTEQFRGIPGDMYMLCLLDFTVMPNSAKQVNTAVNVLSTILGMSSANLGHVQLPAFQKQTKQATVVTHRRNIEEMMLKQGLSVASQIVLLFDKSECLNSDSRASHQVCIAAHHKSFTSAFQSCEAVQLGRVESLPLMPVSEFYDYDDTSKPGKGVKTHIGMLEAYQKGMNLKNTDRFIVFDVVPNRHTEFARAAMEMNLTGNGTIYYCGIVEEKFADITSKLQSACYEKWDASEEAPPRTRPAAAADSQSGSAQVPSLQVLAFNTSLNKPVWPEVLSQRFADGPELAALKTLKAKFEMEFGRASQPQTATTSRVAGSCDFSFDSACPLDTGLEIDLAAVPVTSLSTDRLAMTQSKNGKPSVILMKDYSLWLMNPTDSKMDIAAGEICGFGTGAFEEMIIREDRDLTECSSLVFRLKSDMDLVVHKRTSTLMPFCAFMRMLAVDHGLGSCEVDSHLVSAKYHPSVDGNDPVPVSFRYGVAPLASMKAWVFKPHSPAAAGEADTVKSGVLGAHYSGNFHKVIRNRRASVIWEAAMRH